MAKGTAEVVDEDIQNEHFGVVTSYLYNTFDNVLADEQKLLPTISNWYLVDFQILNKYPLDYKEKEFPRN